MQTLRRLLTAYGLWARQQAIREAAEEFPLLRKVPSPAAIRAASHFASLPAVERPLLAVALVNRSHGLGPPSTSDAASLAAFDAGLKVSTKGEARRLRG